MWASHKIIIQIGLFFLYGLFFLKPVFGECEELSDSINAQKIRTHALTENKRYIFAIHKNDLCVKKRKKNSSWHHVSVPSKLAHNVKGIAVDGAQLVAVNHNNHVFFMRHGLGHRNTFIWTARWGVPFGLGSSLWFSPTISFWDLSFLSPKLDRSYIDSAGQDHIIGFGVTTIFVVLEDRQQIVYFDPWLPADESHQVCGPMRGTLRIKAFSARGSTLAAMDSFGNIFVRRYDFDIAGGDRGIMGYTYKTKKPSDNFFVWLRGERKLPVPDWQKLPKIKGTITDQISLERSGRGAKVRLIRVEGMRKNRTGYFETRFDFVKRSPDLSVAGRPAPWKFYPSNEPLKGQIINNSEAHLMDLGDSKDRLFTRIQKDSPLAELADFNTYCSPATMRITFANEDSPLELKVHHRETLRIFKKAVGAPLRQRGRIEIPQELLHNFDNLPDTHKKFLKSYLYKKRFTKINLVVSAERVKIKTTFPHRHSWEFTR